MPGQGVDGPLALVCAQIHRVDLVPLLVAIPEVAGSTRWHQVQALKLRVVSVQVRQDLCAKLTDVSSGDDAHVGNVEERTQALVHQGWERRFRGG